MATFTHLNNKDEATMVDVGGKATSSRTAKVCGSVQVSKACAKDLTSTIIAEISSVARVAGILAAKKTAELIPHCHQLALDRVGLELVFNDRDGVFHITAESRASGKTGVEMEAFVACSIAALTVYDMTKASDPEAVIGPLYLAEKIGGKNGRWVRSAPPC